MTEKKSNASVITGTSTSADNPHDKMTPHLNFLLTRDLRKSDLALQTGGFLGVPPTN